MSLDREVMILLWSSNLWYLGEGMLGPLFAVFTERIGGDILDISIAWAVYLIISGLLIIIFGRLSDGDGTRKDYLLLLGYAMNAGLTFAYLLVDSPLKLMFVQAGLGVASALAMPTWEALYAEHNKKQNDGWQWGLASGGADLMSGIAILIGGFIAVKFSFTALFVTMGIIQIISTIIQAMMLLPKKKIKPKGKKRS